jgi:cyclopropane fatty-acyl-phospholipid synthase-like methyltransferase
MAKKLAEPQNDAALAVAEEIAELHHKLILETPERIRAGALFTLADQDGTLIARSSRILEAFQVEAIRKTFPSSGAVRLLEVGCGSGIYIRYAALHNGRLTASGLELQAEVAAEARKNIAAWGLADRVEIVHEDVRERAPEAAFDIVTLYNNIYYFPVDERVALFRRLAAFLKPGGFLLAVTCCQGGSVAVEALNLWGAATAGAGRLPTVNEMTAQMREAGFGAVQTFRLAPGESFFAFKAEMRKN